MPDEHESRRGTGSDVVRRLVAECVERAEDEGAGVVDSICRQFPEHAPTIRRRLDHLRRMGLFESDASSTAPSSGKSPFPERLGEFRLLRRLGGGGMGAVYLARQESLDREVALKLIRPDQLYFAGARERFRREVEAVAKLQHPGIVPIYSVGQEGEIPFFAMERIDGCTLAEALRALEGQRPERLTGRDLARAILCCSAGSAESGAAADAGAGYLFEGSWTEVCVRLMWHVAGAVEHAHRRGVLHRDIKPSNIMVTPSGRVMLVDFGLSSAEGASRMTRAGSQLGSLPYMSPEQVRGDWGSVDRRTDVYQMGVALYEALTLALPYPAETGEDTRRLILDGRPVPIRRLNPGVSWDAETVCLKAMERDAASRYATAANLRRDLENVLELRSIDARRPALALRLRRWAQRHPARSASLALGFVIAVGAPIGYAIVEARSAHRIADSLKAEKFQRSRAERNFRKAREAVAKMSEVVENLLGDVPRADAVKRSLLEYARGFHQDFIKEKANDPSVRSDAASAYVDIAGLNSSLGDSAAAEDSYRKAIDMFRELVAENPSDVEYLHGLSEALQDLGLLELTLGRRDEAERSLRRAVGLLESVPPQSSGPDERRALALQRNSLAFFLAEAGRTEEADRFYRLSLADLEALEGAPPDSLDDALALCRVRGNFAFHLTGTGRPDEAEPLCRKTVLRLRDLLRANPDNTSLRELLVESEMNLGQLTQDTGRPAEAEGWIRAAVERGRKLAQDFPDVVVIQEALASASNNLGKLLADTQRGAESRRLLVESIDILEKLAESHPDQAVYPGKLGSTRVNLAAVLFDMNDLSASRNTSLAAIENLEDAIRIDPAAPHYREALTDARLALVGTLVELGNHVEAATAVDALLRTCPEDKESYAIAAAYLARCIPLADADASLAASDRAAVGRDYADRAVAALKKAVALGFGDANAVENGPAFEPLRERPDFRALLEKIASASEAR